MTGDEAARVLAPIALMLEADGYTLATDVTDDGLRLVVVPGPEACEECLVPRDIFAGIVAKTLSNGLGDAPVPAVAVVYPGDER
jgi:hypothetical protein